MLTLKANIMATSVAETTYVAPAGYHSISEMR